MAAQGCSDKERAYLANKLGLEVRAGVRPAQDNETEAGRDTNEHSRKPAQRLPPSGLVCYGRNVRIGNASPGLEGRMGSEVT